MKIKLNYIYNLAYTFKRNYTKSFDNTNKNA